MSASRRTSTGRAAVPWNTRAVRDGCGRHLRACCVSCLAAFIISAKLAPGEVSTNFGPFVSLVAEQEETRLNAVQGIALFARHDRDLWPRTPRDQAAGRPQRLARERHVMSARALHKQKVCKLTWRAALVEELAHAVEFAAAVGRHGHGGQQQADGNVPAVRRVHGAVTASFPLEIAHRVYVCLVVDDDHRFVMLGVCATGLVGVWATGSGLA